ncbi:MAG: hypothetical protein WDM71_10655 [Ferruginibacter sp.]
MHIFQEHCLIQSIQTKAIEFGITGNVYDDVNTAIDAAKQNAGKDDMIIVCGSVFLIGEVNND